MSGEREVAVPGHAAVSETPFLFIGDALALDLVNTQQVVRGKPRDLLATADDLLQWWELARQHHPSAAGIQDSGGATTIDAATLNATKDLRAALRGVLGAIADRAPADSQHVAVLNAALRTGAPALALTREGDLMPIYQTRPDAAPLLFAVALSAVELLRSGDRQRLHRCGNSRCVLMFYDSTKSATRRWCSVGCMDRARSARRYQAAKQR